SRRAGCLAMIVQQRELPWCRGWRVLPELFDGFGVEMAGQGTPENPGQFAIAKARIEGFQPGEFRADGLGHVLAPRSGAEGRMLGPETQHPLVLKASRE